MAANIQCLIHGISVKYNAQEYAITDEIFLMSVDHDIGKVNGLNQWFSNVNDYTL